MMFKRIHLFKYLAVLLLFSCSTTKYYSKSTILSESKESQFSRHPSSISTCSDLLEDILNVHNYNNLDFLTKYNNIKSIIEKKDPSFNQVLESLTFIDYKFTIKELAQVLNKKTLLAETSFAFAFNKYKRLDLIKRFKHFISNDTSKFVSGYREEALLNFLDARKFLSEEAKDFNLTTLKKTHAILMKGGIEGLPSAELGKIRSVGVRTNREELSLESYNNYSSNSYLSLDHKKTTFGDNTIYVGRAEYSSLQHTNSFLLNRIKNYNPALHKKIKKYLKNKLKLSSKDKKALEQNYITALVEERLAWFTRERDQLGKLNSSKSIDQYIGLIANLQRDMVSIHPFVDGNGRTTREFFINYALMREGLPPVRFYNVNMDTHSSVEMWKKQIIEGMEATVSLYDDLSFRLQLDLPIENSPLLFMPFMAQYFKIEGKKQGTKVIEDSFGFIQNNFSDFMIYTRYYLEQNVNFLNLLYKDTRSAIKELEDSYKKFFRSNNVHYNHKKEGDQLVQLHFVDDDFIFMFGSKSYRNPKKWSLKMNRWYSRNLNWRGLSFGHNDKEFDEKKIIQIFTNINSNMASNNIMHSVNNSSTEKTITKVQKEFKRYNDDLINGGLENLVLDHSREGPLYRSSYGYSTSRKRSVGKAFAMGAMVVAEYGKHQEFQHLIKSRILVAAREAEKDVDLMKFRTVRSDYWNAFPRQAEVMGVGAADPDSIMIVQKLDQNGDVIFTYIRNEKKPNEIWVVKGEVESIDGLSKNNIDKIIDLNSLDS